LADALAAELADLEVIRASIDGFHRPKAYRYRLGVDSPEGCYRDSFDYAALRRELLDPLGPAGTRLYRTTVFDFRTDTPRLEPEPPRRAADDAVLLFDGVFLLRQELRETWDLMVFVRVSADESLRRALARDLPLFGSAAEVERRYRSRYLPGQRLYLEDSCPLDHADFVVDNDDPDRPRLSGPRLGDSPR